MDQKELKRLFDQLKTASSEPKTIAKLCEKYLSERTPTYALSVGDVAIDTLTVINPSLKDKDFGSALLRELKAGLIAMLHERGYRDNILTYQEHRLIGSTMHKHPNLAKYTKLPYTVHAILDGQATVEEARKARELEYLKNAGIRSYWGLKGTDDLFMILPDIDDKGATLHDPILVDENGKTIADKLVEGAPYKR